MTERAVARRSRHAEVNIERSCDPQSEAYGSCHFPPGIPDERSPYPAVTDVVKSRYGKAPPQNHQVWEQDDPQLWDDFRASTEIDWTSVVAAAREDLEVVRDNLFEVVLGVAAAAGLKFFGGVPGAIIVAAVSKGGPWLIVAARLKDWLWKVLQAKGRPEKIQDARKACARFVEAAISAGMLSLLGKLKRPRPAQQEQRGGVPDIRRGHPNSSGANPLSTAVTSKGVAEIADGWDPELIGNDGVPVLPPAGGTFEPGELPENNSTHTPSLDKIAKRLETTMRVQTRWNSDDYKGASYRQFTDWSDYSGQMSIGRPQGHGDKHTYLVPIWHESHHAYMGNRKLLDGNDSLYLGGMKAVTRVHRMSEEELEQDIEEWENFLEGQGSSQATAPSFPAEHPLISRHVADLHPLNEFKDTLIYKMFKSYIRSGAWGYENGCSLEELSAYSRECRQLAGILRHVMAEPRADNDFSPGVPNVCGELFRSAAYLLLISEQTRQVTIRALRQLARQGGPTDKTVIVAPRTHHGVEMVNNVALAVQYDVLHASQYLAPTERDGAVVIDLPLADSSPSTALTDYRQRLQNLRKACEVTREKARALLWALELTFAGLMQDDPREPISGAQHVFDFANQISSHARANNNIPLVKPIERRPAPDLNLPSVLRKKPVKPISDDDLPPILRH